MAAESAMGAANTEGAACRGAAADNGDGEVVAAEGGSVGQAADHVVGHAMDHAVDLRDIFEKARVCRADVGSGWDPPASGQMTLWGFTEAVLMLAARVDRVERHVSTRGGAARGGTRTGGGGADTGLAPALERLLSSIGA